MQWLFLEEVARVGEQALQPLPLPLLGLQGGACARRRSECLSLEHHFGVRVQQKPLAGEQANTLGREQKRCGGSALQRLA